MIKDENVDIEREKQDILKHLASVGDYVTMPEILIACKGFDDGVALAKVLNKMLTLGVIERKMGDKIGKNNNNLYEYILPELNIKLPKLVKEILIDSNSSKKHEAGLKIFDAALAKVSRRLELFTITDFDQKIKVLNKLSHVLDDPISGLLKEISKDLESMKRIHG